MQCYKAAFILSLLFCPFLASAAGVAIAGTRVMALLNKSNFC